MPVKLNSRLPVEGNEARIEIVPLIDIMFFLLASFMLVSLSMVNLKSVKVNLPTAAVAATDSKEDVVDISVDRSGGTFLDKMPIGKQELIGRLAQMHKAHPGMRVLISGDREARHGDIVRVLDAARLAGIDKVGIEITSAFERATSAGVIATPAQRSTRDREMP